MPELNDRLLGKHIKERRLEVGITQAELADRIGKSTSAVQKYENGLIEIPFSVLEKIGDALDKNWMLLYPITPDEHDQYKHLIKGPYGHPRFMKAINELLNESGYKISFDKHEELILVEKDDDTAHISQEDYNSLIRKVISYFKYIIKEEIHI